MTKILDRFIFNKERVLGSGTFATVYEGLDLEKNQQIAVKVYKADDDASEDSFQRTVGIFLNIKNESSQRGGKTMWSRHISCNNSLLRDELEKVVSPEESNSKINFLESIDMNAFFVELIAYSCTPEGDPGKDKASGLKFLILDKGSHSLQDSIQDRGHESPISAEGLKALLWALLCSTWALHTSGFVHMDIKPENIVRFSDEKGDGLWKLIDLDDIKAAGGAVSLNKCVFTPYYMPPELAKAELAHGIDKVVVSRLMDVWSVGMVLLEAIFLQPVLMPWFQEWKLETGRDDKFYAWLKDYKTEPIISGDMEEFIMELDPALCDLLRGMLRKDPNDRFCISRCLVHDCFRAMHTGLADQDLLPPMESTEKLGDYQGNEVQANEKSAELMQKWTDDAAPNKVARPAWSPSRACVLM